MQVPTQSSLYRNLNLQTLDSSFLKKKRKINYNEVRQKVRDWEDGEIRIGYVQRNGRGVIKEVGIVGVGDLK